MLQKGSFFHLTPNILRFFREMEQGNTQQLDHCNTMVSIHQQSCIQWILSRPDSPYMEHTCHDHHCQRHETFNTMNLPKITATISRHAENCARKAYQIKKVDTSSVIHYVVIISLITFESLIFLFISSKVFILPFQTLFSQNGGNCTEL